MRRIRLVFVLLAVLLLVPMGLLVHRALQSLALERQVSHRAVAERLFDEMERELSRILRAEEERPVSQYRFDALADPASGVADALLPGAPGASQPYVVGYFQIDPDGRFHSRPSAEASDEAAAASGPRRPTPAKPNAAEIEAWVTQSLRAGAAASSEAVAGGRGAARAEPLPGATRALEPSLREEGAAFPPAPAALPGTAKARKQVSPYEALQALNKGALSRQERQVKLAARIPAAASARPGRADAAEALPSPKARSFAAPSSPSAEAAPTESRGRRIAAAETEAPAPAADRDALDDASLDAKAIFEGVVAGEPAVEVHPMRGRLIDAERLLLYRLVVVGERSFRQGLVVNVPALFRGLDENVVGGSELAGSVGRDFFTVGSEAPRRAAGGGYRYVHRFAEPFDALAVRLTLDPLPGVGGAGYVYAIAVLLLISGTAGLLALYRMVAVTVRFAERRNNFVAAVSHELKTPLTAIRMYAEMLRDGMVPDEAKRLEYYGTITAESERLTRLINNVLEFSRLEQGTREMSLVAGSIGPVVREAAELLVPHAQEVGFRIEVEVEDGLPPVRLDRDAVLQVVFNLVDNALKYARGTGDRVIAIRCTRSGDGVSVAVRDRGPGVSSRHLAKIFEPFYRGEDELTRTAKGTGIGLALVRGLAERMGAAVRGRNLAEGGFEVALTFRPA